MRMRFSILKLLLILSLLCTLRSQAAEPAGRAEDLLPDTTLVALSVADMGAFRAAAGKTQLAEMYAQPEMQQFLAPALEQLRKSYAELRTKNPLLPSLADLDQGMLSGEITFGIFPRAPGSDVPVGMILSLRPQKFEALSRLLEPAFGGELPPNGKPFVFGTENDPNAPAGAQFNGRMLFGSPVSELNAAIERLKNPAAAKGSLGTVEAFNAARAQLKFSSAYAYVNLAAIQELLLKLIPRPDAESEKIASALKALGFDSVPAFLLSAGLSQDEIVIESALRTAAGKKPTGVFTLCMTPHGPISKESLKIAAADAPYVSASQIDWPGHVAALHNVANAAGIGRQLDGVMQMADLRLGFSIERDLLANLGSEMVVARTAFDTSPPMSMGFGMSMIASIALKDAAKVESCLVKLHGSFGGDATGDPLANMVQFRTVEHHGKTIYYLKQLMNGTWSFAVAGNRLLVGSSVNAVRRGLDQLDAKDDILSNADFQKTIARLTGAPFDVAKLPQAFAYQADQGSGGASLLLTTAGLAGTTATLAAMAEAAERTELPAPDFSNSDPFAEIERFFKRPSGQVVLAVAKNVDYGMWPDSGFFAKYRRARGALFETDPVSVYFRTELPFPSIGSNSGGSPMLTVAVVGMVAAIVFPVLGRAREAARRASAANNMSQIGKALVMYSDVPEHNGAFPADIGDLYPEYVADHRVFLNPRFQKQDENYVYISGLTPNDTGDIVLYENPPENRAADGRNVLLASGSVEWLDAASFERELEQTATDLKDRNIELKKIPVSHSAIAKRKK